jgi:hypothetical protein
MPDYRAYIVGIDGSFNSIGAKFLHNRPDDATAIEAAKQLAEPQYAATRLRDLEL